MEVATSLWRRSRSLQPRPLLAFRILLLPRREEELAMTLFCFRGRDPAPTLLTKAVQVGVDQLDWEDWRQTMWMMIFVAMFFHKGFFRPPYPADQIVGVT